MKTQKDPKQMTAGEINRECDKIAKVDFPKMESAFKSAGYDSGIATCYLDKRIPLHAQMIALRARWYALQNEVLDELGPRIFKFPKNYRRKNKSSKVLDRSIGP